MDLNICFLVFQVPYADGEVLETAKNGYSEPYHLYLLSTRSNLFTYLFAVTTTTIVTVERPIIQAAVI